MNLISRLLAVFQRTPRPLIPGPTITLGTKVYTIAPLNFATLKQITPLLSSFTNLGKTPTEKDYDNMVMVVWLALKRNHPHLTLREVERELDLSNIQSITTKTMTAGGAINSGEATAGSR